MRRSTDHGATWSLSDSYAYTGSNGFNIPSGLAADSTNALYTTGAALDGSSVNHWVTRKSSDHGASWAISDDYTDPSGYQSTGSSIVITSANTLFSFRIAGADHGFNGGHWMVRKSVNGGSTWTIALDYQYPGSTTGLVGPARIDPSNNIFFIGTFTDSGGILHWLVEKSPDLGATWLTVDDFIYPGGTSSTPVSLLIDPTGVIYVSGSGVDSSGFTHWLLRKSGNSGSTWTTVDDYDYSGGTTASPSSPFLDSLGRLFVPGSAKDSGAFQHWILRTIGCP